MADTNSQRQRWRAETAGWQAGPGIEGSAGTDVADADSAGSQGHREEYQLRGPGEEEEVSRRSDVSHADGQRGRSGHAEGQHAEDAGQSPGGTGHDASGVVSWATEPDVGRVVNGAAFRVDRLRLLGNGVVPYTAAKAWIVLNDQLIKAMRE